MSYGREAGILCAAGIHSLKSTCLSARWPLPAPPLPSSQQVICHSELRPHEKDLCRSHCPTLGQTDLAAAGESVCESGSVTEKKSPAPSDQLSSVSGHANTATPPRHHATTSMEVALEDKDSCSSANVEYHQAFRDRWKETDATMCRHSMSFHLHHAIRSDFFASYLYLLDKTPMVKLFPVTCEYIKGEKQFYYRAQQFYEDVEASEEGMMGDFVEISHVDLEGSRQFLQRFVGPGKAGTHCALDCGSGIGRVTKGVLLPVFEKMEMADMMEHFLLHAHEEYLGDDADRIETYYCYNLQEFTPPKNKYDVIWMQWVACHLTDKDLMNFLFRCKKSLRPNGVIIMKDNMARQGCKLDSNDSTISRHLDIMKCIIAKAGLEVLEVELQEGFPEVIMPVWMIAMK